MPLCGPFNSVTSHGRPCLLSATGPLLGVDAHSGIKWGATITLADPPTYKDFSPMARSALDARKLRPGIFGADYPRAVKLRNGSWLMGYTTFRRGDSGYLADPRGGTCLVIDQGSADARTWKPISTVCDPGRDMDNGEFIQVENGDILLGARSVRWQESYRLPVFRSSDMGMTWTYLSTIDANEGRPGELGEPDKGVYEPHFYQLDDGTLAVMYSTEKHVIENPSYSCRKTLERWRPQLGSGDMGFCRWRCRQTGHARVDQDEGWKIHCSA
jgi:hypothetical protein